MNSTPPAPATRSSVVRDVSVQAVVAGLVVVLVGYASTGAIVFQAAQQLGATQSQINSWMWALGLGMGLCCILPSLWFRTPVVAAWSTPGAALIATTSGIAMPEAIGAFLICSALIIVVGLTGWFVKFMNKIPMSIAAAMFAGVLLRFGLEAFASAKTAPLLVFCMLLVYVIGRRFFARYAVVVALAAGISIAALQGTVRPELIAFELVRPEFMMPSFSLSATVSLAIPLFIVTMASQNIPGVAAIRAAGYDTPVSPVITTIGAINALLATFGAFALNLAAITAAIAMGEEAHPDKSKRYIAAIAAGVFYCLLGIFGAAVGTLFAALPKELIVTIAGLALVMTIGGGLVAALKEEKEREPAMFTFLVTASGVSLFGIGSAFWGLVVGLLVFAILRKR